jgi:hypothetical protein
MRHFKPAKKKVIKLEFGYYFTALIIGPLTISIATNNIYSTSSLILGLAAAAMIAYAIGCQKEKKHTRDIEIHENYIVGPGPLNWFVFEQSRVKVPIDKLKVLQKAQNHKFSLNKKVIKLGDEKGRYIRVVTALYDQKLLNAIEAKLDR